MQDPATQVREYLEKLIQRFLYIKSLRKQFRLIGECEVSGNDDALNAGYSFFRLVTISFWRSILMELCKFVSDEEQKSLVDWLRQAKTHASSIGPTRYNPDYTGDGTHREPIDKDEYCEIIEQHEAELGKQNNVITRIRGQRDKSLAHTDASYFNDPDKLYKKYDLNMEDIDSLINTIDEILRDHHVYLLRADIDLEAKSAHDVDTVLKLASAFIKVRKDKKLIKSGFRPADYLYGKSGI